APALENAPPPDPGIDGWLVTAPWPAIVDAARATAGLPLLFEGAKHVVVARPRLAIAVRSDRAAVLRARPGCEPLTWVCLGRAAAVGNGWAGLGGRADWGQVKLGIPSAGSAIGLAVLGQ